MQTIAPGPRTSTDSRLAALCAGEIWQAFRRYEQRFDEITRRARQRFLARDWRGSFDDTKERLLLYSKPLENLRRAITALLIERLHDHSGGSAIRAVSSSLIGGSSSSRVCE